MEREENKKMNEVRKEENVDWKNGRRKGRGGGGRRRGTLGKNGHRASSCGLRARLSLRTPGRSLARPAYSRQSVHFSTYTHLSLFLVFSLSFSSFLYISLSPLLSSFHLSFSLPFPFLILPLLLPIFHNSRHNSSLPL